MDFKLDLKLQNEVDLSISKNELFTVFTTHQTDSMFILTSDLKKGGYERKDIKIEINEDGSRMTISGEKPNIQFHKTFIIPEGVVLDKVKARFDQDQSRLTIRMPKLVKGLVTGTWIQEYKHPAPAKGITSDQHKEDVNEETKQEPKPDSQAEKPEKTTSSSTMYTTPVIAGSTLFVSLIVVFFSFIRSRNQSSKKTN
ncbi:hypothetical protein L1987_23508 [Smallanthus sonchifolius]|uniref:Uncharacterized protein n=1 Tax=Smallanthus sonchifolius TaxID=185202 RepID=A0ACB9IH32_9ASTR|nr:hypothetical protein L1987_23508 [Smallanthus sonchifolius]